MVSLVIYGIIAIALASAAGYALLVFTNTSHQTTYTDENDIRMEVAVTALRASLLALQPQPTGGVLFPPMGVSTSDNQGHTYTSLPASLGVVGATPWAQPYNYCPIAPAVTFALTPVTSGTITSYDTSTYSVSTYTSDATQGLPYVVASPSTGIYATAAAAGYVGFITSSLGPGQPVPACDSITFSGNTPIVAGGMVRGITAGFAYNQRVIASVDRMDIWVATAEAGDGTGRDINNPTILGFATTLWQSLQPRQTDIHLAAGNYSITSNLDSLNDDTGNGSLNLGQPFGDGENTSLIIGAEPGAGVTVTLNNELTLNSATTFSGLTLSTAFPITAFKPLTLDTVTLKDLGTSAVPLTTFGTTFTAYDTAITGVPLNFNNSTVEFYDRLSTGSALTNSPITATQSQIEFDLLTANSTGYSLANTVNPPLVYLTNSSLTIPAYVTLSGNSHSVSSPPIFMVNSRLHVGGTLTLQGQGTGIEAHDGSTVSIWGTATVSPWGGGSMSRGAFIEGSKMALNGSFTVKNVVSGGTAIALQHGELTGYMKGAAIHVTTPKLVSCVNLYMGLAAAPPDVLNPAAPNNAAGTQPENYPLYINPTSLSSPPANRISFAQAQFGMPPLTSDQNLLPDPNAALVVNSLSHNNTTSIPVTLTPPVSPTSASLAYSDLEPAVRNLVNAEYITGSSLTFVGVPANNGGCTP